jgi:hypothetical protein
LRDSAIEGVQILDDPRFNRPFPGKSGVEVADPQVIAYPTPFFDPDLKKRLKFAITQRIDVVRQIRDLPPSIVLRNWTGQSICLCLGVAKSILPPCMIQTALFG